MEGLERRFVNSRLKRVFQEHFEIRIYTNMLRKNGCGLHGKRILDAGCGAGYGLEIIRKRFNPLELYGLDIDTREANLARKKRVADEIFIGDLARTGFKDNSFDAVFAFTVLHHMPHWQMGLRELYRIIKPGGILLLNELNRGVLETLERTLGVKHPKQGRFSWSELEGILNDLRFNVVDRRIFLGSFGFYLCRT